MSVKQIETLIMIVFIALFFLYFFWLRDYRKRYVRLAIFEGVSSFVAVVMMIIFDKLPEQSFMAWSLCRALCLMMAVVFFVMMVITVILILYRKSKGIKDENPNVRSRFDYPYLSQLVDVEEERIRAFHKRLRRKGIPDHIVLIGVTPYCEECFNLLKRDDGKWEVFYGERGQKTNPRVFDTFEEAGDDLISRL
jgi:hypothetical protein